MKVKFLTKSEHIHKKVNQSQWVDRAHDMRGSLAFLHMAEHGDLRDKRQMQNVPA